MFRDISNKRSRAKTSEKSKNSVKNIWRNKVEVAIESVLFVRLAFVLVACIGSLWKRYVYAVIMVDPLKIFWVLTNSTYLGEYS